jgi:SAM-dependent methyltransferase
MIARARERTRQHQERIHYGVLDTTDEAALLALGENGFDAALCQMALFDMAEIEPLLQALPRLLRPGGRFVFSVIHPCFNSPHMAHVAEMEDRAGDIVTQYNAPRLPGGLFTCFSPTSRAAENACIRTWLQLMVEMISTNHTLLERSFQSFQ